jgi:multiple sugar transport system permease protein
MARRSAAQLARRAVVIHIPVTLIVASFLFPFLWMAITSIKPTSEIYSMDANPFYTLSPTLRHYRFLGTETLFGRWFLNTLLITIGSTAISLVASLPAAYALARLRFRGAAVLGTVIFIFYLVPPSLLFIPMSALINALGLTNTLTALVLVYPTFLIPFATWLLTGYFRAVPREVEECALVDGCSKVGAMLRVALPLAIPGILSVLIFAFTLSWNEFLYALTLITDRTSKTLPVGIVTELMIGDSFWWGSLMGAALLSSLPVALFYSFFVDYFVAGMTAGAVKG